MRMNPIQSVKNQRSTTTTTTAAVNVLDFVALATEQGVATKVVGNEVPVGATVYSMDISVSFISGSASDTGTFEWCFMKLRDGQSVTNTISSPNWSDIGLSSGRNQVIKSYMTVFSTEDGGSVKYNPHIRIPKIYQRMRSGDQFVIVTKTSQIGLLLTGARYKYYQ